MHACVSILRMDSSLVLLQEPLEVYILGTNHFSQASAEQVGQQTACMHHGTAHTLSNRGSSQVTRLVEAVKPENVVVEICRSRVALLNGPSQSLPSPDGQQSKPPPGRQQQKANPMGLRYSTSQPSHTATCWSSEQPRLELLGCAPAAEMGLCSRSCALCAWEGASSCLCGACLPSRLTEWPSRWALTARAPRHVLLALQLPHVEPPLCLGEWVWECPSNLEATHEASSVQHGSTALALRHGMHALSCRLLQAACLLVFC